MTSESDSDNVSPKLNPPPIRNCTTQVNPRWTIVDIIEEFSGNLTMPQYNPNNKINRCATIDPNFKKKRGNSRNKNNRNKNKGVAQYKEHTKRLEADDLLDTKYVKNDYDMPSSPSYSCMHTLEESP